MPPTGKKSPPDASQPVTKPSGHATAVNDCSQQPEITGLCVNCDKRFTCRHCRQLGGVWYCEEYE
jgi:hypothetical protein